MADAQRDYLIAWYDIENAEGPPTATKREAKGLINQIATILMDLANDPKNKQTRRALRRAVHEYENTTAAYHGIQGIARWFAKSVFEQAFETSVGVGLVRVHPISIDLEQQGGGRRKTRRRRKVRKTRRSNTAR